MVCCKLRAESAAIRDDTRQLSRAVIGMRQRGRATTRAPGTICGMTTPQLLNLGLSGFAMAGADVGGFAGTPQPELLTRWLEVAAFHPIDRDHTAMGTDQQEPWENGTRGGPEPAASLHRRALSADALPLHHDRRDEPDRGADHAAALSGLPERRC